MGEMKNSLQYRDRLESSLNDLENTLRNMINLQQSAHIQNSAQFPITSGSNFKKVFPFVMKIINILVCKPFGMVAIVICESGQYVLTGLVNSDSG